MAVTKLQASIEMNLGLLKVFPMYHEKRMSMQNIAFSNSFLCKISHSDAIFLCKISHFTNCFCIFAPKNRMIMVDKRTLEFILTDQQEKQQN